MATMNQVGVGLSGVTGSGNFAGSTGASISSPTFTTPALGTPSSGSLINCTNLSWGTQGGTGIPLRFASGTLTANEIKSLIASPVTIIPAPGANKALIVVEISWQYIYVAPAYTAGSSQLIRCRYVTGSTIFNTMIGNSTLTGTANATGCGPTAQVPSSTSIVNNGIELKNPLVVEVTDGNGYVNWWISYLTVDLTTF